MLEEIELKDFKNYLEARFAFKNGINAIIGKNGRGKTNLLEAVYFSIQGRTVRSGEVKELVRRGGERACIRVAARGTSRMEKGVEVSVEGEKKESGYIRGIRVVMFYPDDLWMVKGGPEARRRQLDEALAEIKKSYRVTLREYQKVLRQRNEAIKMVRRKEGEKELIRSWNPLLLEWGTQVVRERAEGLQELQQRMSGKGVKWGAGEVTAKLYSSMGEGLYEKERVTRKLERIEDAEIGRGTTLIGPHRDEVILELRGRNVRRECSQGEQKLVALMWKFCVAETIRDIAGEQVIPLMDDCLSELDKENRMRVLEEMQGWGQVLLTHTEDLTELSGAEKIFLT